MTDTGNSNLLSNKIEKSLQIDEVDQILLSMLEKDDVHTYSIVSRKSNIVAEIKSILTARIGVAILQQLEPFSLQQRIIRFKALNQIFPDKIQPILRYFEPNYLMSNILYQTCKFTLKDEINYSLKNRYQQQILNNYSYSVGINYLAGCLAATFSWPIKIFYNCLLYPNQFFEQEARMQTILDRLKWNSKFLSQFSCFFYNKVVFSTVYFGTFDTLNSIKNKNSNYSQIYYSILASAIAQICGEPFLKATQMYLKSQQDYMTSITVKYSSCLKPVFQFYWTNPSKMFDRNSRFLYHLIFNSILIYYYELMKTYYLQKSY